MATAMTRQKDQELVALLEDRLLEELPDEAEQVQVDVVDGQATLAGTVATPELRRRAEAIAQSIEGIGFVIDNLRVAQAGTTGATG